MPGVAFPERGRAGAALGDYARFADAAFQIGGANQHPFRAVLGRQMVAVVNAVLQGQYDGIRPHQRRNGADGGGVVVHFDRE